MAPFGGDGTDIYTAVCLCPICTMVCTKLRCAVPRSVPYYISITVVGSQKCDRAIEDVAPIPHRTLTYVWIVWIVYFLAMRGVGLRSG